MPSIDKIQFEHSPKSEKEKSVSSATPSGSEEILISKKSVVHDVGSPHQPVFLTQSSPFDAAEQKESVATSHSESNDRKSKNKEASKVLRKKSSTRMFETKVKFQKDDTKE